jgi:hypothetical protein
MLFRRFTGVLMQARILLQVIDRWLGLRLVRFFAALVFASPYHLCRHAYGNRTGILASDLSERLRDRIDFVGIQYQIVRRK